MNAQIDLVEARAAHRDELRAEALDDALPRIKDEARALWREREPLLKGWPFEWALAFVVDAPRRDASS